MRVLITGATGFIGGHFVKRVLGQGSEPKITHLRYSGRNPDNAAELIKLGGEFIEGDLNDSKFVEKICDGMDAVIHCAGRSGLGGRREPYVQGNINVSKYILEACRAGGVKILVNIGTPSIYFDYTDNLNRDEDYLPEKFSDHYASTKYEAEALILKGNSPELMTISLRPRFVLGEGEENILPRIISLHRSGTLKKIGDGQNVADVTSVHNMVDAILLSLKASPEAGGRAYNITNGDPVKLWDFFSEILERLGEKPITKKVPYGVLYSVGFLLEFLFRLRGKDAPITRLGAGIMAKSMTLDISNARKYLGYIPHQSNQDTADDFLKGRGVFTRDSALILIFLLF